MTTVTSADNALPGLPVLEESTKLVYIGGSVSMRKIGLDSNGVGMRRILPLIRLLRKVFPDVNESFNFSHLLPGTFYTSTKVVPTNTPRTKRTSSVLINQEPPT